VAGRLGRSLIVWAALLPAGALAQPGPSAPKTPSSSLKDRPNLVVVLLDDADAEITESMPRLRSLLMDKGVRFASAIANTPLCGPSRALLLSGSYAHNTKVYYNNGPEGGYTPWLAGGFDDRNIGPRLNALGYRTGIFGKYLNDFPTGRPEAFVPKGWDDFRGVMSDREARNNRYTLNENGVLATYEASKGGYQTDLLSQRLQTFIRDSEREDDRPFFAFFSISSPHVPPEPAERHLLAFPDERAPRKPSFDESDLKDKPKALREQAKALTAAEGREIDVTYRAMKQSLLSVEDAIEALLRTLAETGELEKTYIFLTSDNGWMRGEHRIPSEKYVPYEESIRVPLFVTGPGVPLGRSQSPVVGLVDLAPTLLELGGAPLSSIQEGDGRSLLPLLRSEALPGGSWRHSILIEHFGGGSPFRVRSYSGLRSETDVYVEYASGEKEYYDLLKDPHQMENKARSLSPQKLGALSRRLAAMKSCSGAQCRAAEAAPKESPASADRTKER
jgi:N-acetylglucosamine-6-sulfatase